MVTFLSILATVLSIGGQVLIAHKSKLTFPVWILANILWIVVNLVGPVNYPQLTMFIVYTLLSAYSWYKWK